jgi:hypothetical protein
MLTFKSAFAFSEFRRTVTQNRRYRYDAEQEEFLKTLEETATYRIATLAKDITLYRAQIGSLPNPRYGRFPLKDTGLPLRPERMVPLPKSAKEGRVNPKGIPCLYLADNPTTAMAECRPWMGANLSVGHFRTIRDLKLIDCDSANATISIGDMDREYQPHFEPFIWRMLSDAYSEPVTDSDLTAEYAVTQVLSELFQSIGFDGIKYRSVVGEGGFSFALFNISDAQLYRCAVHDVTAIHHTFSDEKRPYTINDAS